MELFGIFLIAVYTVYYVAAEEAVADAEAVASDNSVVCSCYPNIKPVCGSDGRTYRNICYLQCASLINQVQGLPPIFYKYSGACIQETCYCTTEYKPICANDGKTYNNKCLLNCENRRRNALGLAPLYIVKLGPCTACPCANNYDPVCASDKKSYLNPCFLKCENDARKKLGLPPLNVVYKGVCGCNCNKKYDPVCGSDEKTYNNICLLQCESNKRVLQGLSPIYLSHYGECVCNCYQCGFLFQPVCGSDGKTYYNICWLTCNSDCNVKKGKPKINLVKIGYC